MKPEYSVVERKSEDTIYSGNDFSKAIEFAESHKDHCTLYIASQNQYKTTDGQAGDQLRLTIRRYWGGGEWDPVKGEDTTIEDRKNLVSLVEKLIGQN